MVDDFSTLKSPSECARALKGLLAEARRSLGKDGTSQDRMNVHNRLEAFGMEIPTEVRTRTKLDEIADEMMDALIDANIERALARMRAGNKELKRLISALDGISTEAESSASAISLAPVTRVVESAGEVIKNLKELRSSLTGSHSELQGRIDKVITAVQKLRDEVETL